MFVVLAMLLLATVPDEPRQLKYVFKAGDEVKYINTNLRTTTYKKAGKTLEVSLEQKSANLWKVLSVSGDGVAEVSQTITRLRVTQKGGPLGVQTIDSSSEENPPAVQGLFEDLTKSEIRFKMSPRGEVGDVVLPAKLKERLHLKKEGEASLVTEDALVRMVKGSTFILPKKPLSVGDGWDLDPYTYQESGYWITMKTRFTYEGPVEQEGRKLLKVSRSAEYDVRKPKDESVAQEVTIKRQKAEGFVLLGAATCALVESNMAESLGTESGAGQEKTETETVINSTIKLKASGNEKTEKPTP
jgi:Family of unknown function (DUF6263)